MRVAVIPALDEARTIGSVVLQAAQHVDQVIVVDDGSSDATAAVAGLAGAEVIRHERNRGKGKALRTGFDRALELGAEAVVTLDADGQHDPMMIPRLLGPLLDRRAKFVIGSRSLNGDGQSPRGRRAGRRMLDATTNRLAGTRVLDTQSGYRAFDATALAKILPASTGMGVESVMLADAARQGFTIEEVPVANHYNHEAVPSQHPVRHGASVFRSLLRWVREEHPLGFFGTLGILSLLYGAWAGYRTADHYWSTDEFWPGKAMLSMLFLILGSISVLGGMILDFLATRLRRSAA